MGTPQFAVPSLQALIVNHDVQAVFTQPDRVSGRGKKLTMSPVKQLAQKHNIAIYQPVKLNADSSVEVITELAPDVIVVVAYGQLIGATLLNLPRYGCLNVHASLLPRWRGAAPIQMAIVAGDDQTGVTIMQMDSGLDTGDMLLKRRLPITADTTAGELHDQLMPLGADALLETLRLLQDNRAHPIAQDAAAASYAPKLNKQMAKIDWSQSAEQIVNAIHGYNPWPAAHCNMDGQTFKILRARALTEPHDAAIGSVCAVDKHHIYVGCAQGTVRIDELQPPNSKKMSTAAYLRGHQVNIGQFIH